MSDFARRLSRVPEQPLIDEMQAALDNLTQADLDLHTMPIPGYTPFLGTPCGDNHPDNHDRDAGRHCLACNHDLDLDADFRCTRCGSPS